MSAPSSPRKIGLPFKGDEGGRSRVEKSMVRGSSLKSHFWRQHQNYTGIQKAAELIRRDANVYLVDADQFSNLNYGDTELLSDHAAVSDLILLNKADLASAERLGEIEQMLKISAPYAHLIRTRQGDVGLSLLMDQFGGAGTRRLLSDVRATAAHPAFVSWSRETTRPLSRAAFDRFARRLPTSCVHAKGVLMFSDLPQCQYVFNLVGTRASLVQRELSDPALGLVLPRFSSGLFRAMFAMKEIWNGKTIHRRVPA